MYSTHTGFPGPHVRSLTEELVPLANHWKNQGFGFDAICIGYLSDPAQAEAVLAVLDGLTGTVILDPAMGDHGKLYSRMTDAHVAAMKKLCQRADVVLPNVTEAAFLTGTPYETAVQAPESLPEKLKAMGPGAVVITGVAEGDTVGFVGADAGEFRYRAPYIPKQLHGTGDLFTAVFAGGYVSGKCCEEAAKLAARFVERVVDGTESVTPFGAEFEKQLPWLWGQL